MYIYFQNPILKTVSWLLTTLTCQMVDCPPAKETFAEDNMAISLNRLWPWCMLTDQLRSAVVYLLFVFSNDCPKGIFLYRWFIPGCNVISHPYVLLDMIICK